MERYEALADQPTVTIYVNRRIGEATPHADECHGDPAEWETVKYVSAATFQGAVDALRVIANDTTHDGRWAAGRAEAALVAMGVDPRLRGQ